MTRGNRKKRKRMRIQKAVNEELIERMKSQSDVVKSGLTGLCGFLMETNEPKDTGFCGICRILASFDHFR